MNNEYCVVPHRFNSNVKTPDKLLFFNVPEDPKFREKWMTAVRQVDTTGPQTVAFCYEDHFDIFRLAILESFLDGRITYSVEVVPREKRPVRAVLLQGVPSTHLRVPRGVDALNDGDAQFVCSRIGRYAIVDHSGRLIVVSTAVMLSRRRRQRPRVSSAADARAPGAGRAGASPPVCRGSR
ncbi:hypothetical protein EVAR_94421_1 [Eumeta japonica]|uniref:THAP-type domain-containing protein n=1 Tax=Eumeta variegata TaxID=151549 RepID=A0A4C1TQ33_EUMVA|nr:hypothetical protein EVAR_94421_1 [Eumeta japonica]